MERYSEIFTDTRLNNTAISVYMYLRHRCQQETECWPAVSTIGADMSLSRRTVQRALADLERCGYAERIPRYRDNGGCTSNLYRIK